VKELPSKRKTFAPGWRRIASASFAKATKTQPIFQRILFFTSRTRGKEARNLRREGVLRNLCFQVQKTVSTRLEFCYD